MTLDIMIDIDDVAMPWADTVHNACVVAGIVPDGISWSQWHMWEDYGVDKSLWDDVVAELVINGLYSDTEPLPYAVQAINLLRFEGHRAHIVTARGFMENSDLIRSQTPAWLEKFGIGYDSLTFSKDKVRAMRDLGVVFDYAIDDGVHNYKALDEAGVPVYLQDQPHNRTFEVPTERRVSSLWEFATKVVLKEEA